MAKALKYFFEFSDIGAEHYKVEIWVEGFAGTATELIAGGNPLTRTYNKDVGEKYIGGIVPSVISIEAISNASFHAVDFTGQNYGDAVAVVYKNTVLQYNAIIVPFEGSDSDLNDGIYSVNLSAECGLVNLKTITFLPSGTRKKLLDVIIECINNIPYVNSFGYSVVDNVDLRDADLNKPYYYESFIEDKFFEGLSCYDVINSIIQQYGQFTFTDGRWDIKNIAEISKVNSVKRTYSNAGVLQASTAYNRPDESVTRTAGGDFGLMFSQKSVTIEKTKSISRSLNANANFENTSGWTFEGIAPLLFEITNGYLTNKGNTWFTQPSNLPDSSYVQSPATTYFPFKSSFERTPKQEIKIKFKSTKGSYIKNLRLQIIAVQDLDANFYYLTNEGSWYRAVAGVNTPIYAADFKDNVEEVITVPQVPFLLPDTPHVLSNVIPVYGEFMPFPYLDAVSDLPYKIYVRVFMPERLGDDFPAGLPALDLTTQIDYIHITAEEINNDSLNGFTKKFGVSTQKDRSGDLTIKLGVGYPSFPVAYDSLFFNGSTTKPITLYNSLPIEYFIADSYLSVLSQRQKFYQGTVIANIEFGDLLDIDGEKHRIHNYEYNYKLKQANIKTIGLGVNADTIEELPVYDSDVNLDIDSILNQVDIDMNRKYGDNLNLKFVDKNIQINTLADGQKSLSLRQDFRISRLYSDDVFLRTASDGSIQDVAEDTEGNFTLIKPAKDGTYALLEDIEDLAWLQEGNTATVATKKLGTLDNFDFNIIRNNVNIGQIKSTGLDLLDNRLDVGAVQYNVATAQTVGVAKTIWNDTFGTLEFGLKGGNVAYRLGQSSITYVKHADNSGLTKGTVVYTVGSNGINKTVRLAQANAESTSSKTFGIIAETVTGGEKAFCTTFGNLEGINTSAFAEGATIYLSPTVAGGLTTTKPSAPNHMVLVGFCLRSHATQGVIFVKVQNGFEIDELHDVAIGTLANNNLLAYEAGTSLWKNKTFAELGLSSGTGTTNFVTKWSNATGGLTNSQIFDNGVNLGIATPTPTAKLEINQDANAMALLVTGGSGGLDMARFVRDVGGNVTVGINGSGGDAQIYFTTTGNTFAIGTDSSSFKISDSTAVGTNDRLTIDSIGNVGIGTTSPSATLHVVRNGAETLRLQRSSGTNFRIATYLDAVGTQMYSTTSADNAYNPIRIDGSYIALNTDTGGNVGIGTVTPTQKLTVVGNIMSTEGGTAALPKLTLSASTTTGIYTPMANGWGVSTNAVSRLVIDAVGNVGIGTTNPTQKLDVAGGARFTNDVIIGGGAVGVNSLIASKNITGGVDASGIRSSGQIQSDVTNSAFMFRAVVNQANFDLPTLIVYESVTGTINGTGTTFAHFRANGNPASFTNVYGFQSFIASGTNRYGIYNSGTAQNHFRGNVGIGAGSTVPTTELDVLGITRTTNLRITNGAAVGKVWQCNNVNGTGEWVTPLSSERYIGEWAANSGVAPSASPTTGDYYVVNTAGTYLGITYAAGDEIYWNGTAWLKRSNFLTLPIATASVLGGIKIGTGLAIDGSGVVSVASLATAKTISATGDGTWSVSFNGSADVSGALTLANVATAGTYRSVTINAKGLVTAGTNPTTLAGYGIADAYTKTESDDTFHKTADTTAATLEIPYVNVLSATRKQLVTSGIKIKLEAAFGDGTLAQNLGLEVQGRINIVYDSNNAVYLGKDAGKLDINTNSRNTIVGHFGLDASETTTTNTGLGYEVLSNLISGSGNVALGAFAGRNADRTLPLTISTDGIFIGRNSRPLADSSLNEIVIGANLRGKGNNTVAIGDSSITYNYFNGSLDYTGLLSISGVTGTSGQFLKRGTSNNVWASIGHADISDLSTFTGFDSRYQLLDGDLTAIAALAGTSGILRKTAANTWSLDTTSYFTTPTGLTTNYVSKWGGSAFANSQIFDNGTSVGIAIATPSTTSKLHVNNAVGNSVRFQNTYFSNSVESGTGFARGGIFNNAEYIEEGGVKVWKIRNIGANDAAGMLFGNSGTLNFITVPNTGIVDKSLTHDQLLSNARLTILATGLVGINTTTPAYTLDVLGTTRTTNLLITSGATSGNFLKCNNVNGTSVWSSITTSDITDLSSWAGSTSITTLGTITAGTWNGTAIATTRGGTGLSAIGTANQMLRVNAGATALEYFTPTFISGNQTISITGDATGSGTTSIALTLANSGVTLGTYRSVTVNSKGLVTAGSNPTTLAGYAITDAYTKSESDARFVSLTGSYVNPSWITSLAWTKLTGVPTTFAPSAHTHAAVDIVSGVIATARLASGTASATTFLRGDQTWATLPAPTLTSTRIGFGSGSNLLTSSANFAFEDDRIISIKNGGTSKMEIARYVGLNNYGLYVHGGNLELQVISGGNIFSQSNHSFQGRILLNNLAGTAGQVLTSQGSGANPTWTTVSGGTQNLDSVLGVGNTAINKQIILNGTNSVFDSAAIMFYKNGAEKGKLHYDNQFVERLRLSSTSIIQIESSVSVGLYGTSAIIGSLSGTGTRMVVADASGVLSTQAIPSGGIGTIDQVLAAGNTAFDKNLVIKNGGVFFTSQNNQSIGNLAGVSKLDGSAESIRLTAAANVSMEFYAGILNLVSASINIGPTSTSLVNISGTPFKLALSDFAGGIYTPANGDKILITYDGSKSAFVLQKINILLSGGISYLTL